MKKYKTRYNEILGKTIFSSIVFGLAAYIIFDSRILFYVWVPLAGVAVYCSWLFGTCRIYNLDGWRLFSQSFSDEFGDVIEEQYYIAHSNCLKREEHKVLKKFRLENKKRLYDICDPGDESFIKLLLNKEKTDFTYGEIMLDPLGSIDASVLDFEKPTEVTVKIKDDNKKVHEMKTTAVKVAKMIQVKLDYDQVKNLEELCKTNKKLALVVCTPTGNIRYNPKYDIDCKDFDFDAIVKETAIDASENQLYTVLAYNNI